MHKPTYQQPAKHPGKVEGQPQKPQTGGNAQPFDESRDPSNRQDNAERRDESPQQQPRQARPQDSQDENDEPKQS